MHGRRRGTSAPVLLRDTDQPAVPHWVHGSHGRALGGVLQYAGQVEVLRGEVMLRSKPKLLCRGGVKARKRRGGGMVAAQVLRQTDSLSPYWRAVRQAMVP